MTGNRKIDFGLGDDAPEDTNSAAVKPATGLGDFAVKTKSKPKTTKAQIKKLAADEGFESRQAAKPKRQGALGNRSKRLAAKPSNMIFSVRTHDSVAAQLIEIAEAQGWGKAKAFEEAVMALTKSLKSKQG